MLLGQEDLAAEEQHAYVAALLQPLIHQVCATLMASYTCRIEFPALVAS